MLLTRKSKKESLLNKLKLKHLETLLADRVDYASLMVDIYGYKNSWLGKKFMFLRLFNKTFNLIESIKNIDPKKLILDPAGYSIKYPEDIDVISFSAMMEIHMLVDSPQEGDLGDMMAQLIALACYSENREGKFDSESLEFKEFKQYILNSPALSMIGLYNHLYDAVEVSSKIWQERFQSVHVEDKDYDNAGGDRMSQFNVITTIKNSCRDFNVTYEEAWQISYVVTQTNSYARATEAHIQKKMSEIKEDRMRINRKTQQQ